MYIHWSRVLLLAISLGMPLGTSAAPSCTDGKCPAKSLAVREAAPVVPPPVAKPVVAPKPIEPGPVAPGGGPEPLAPEPLAPEPLAPAGGKPNPAGEPQPQEPAPLKPQEEAAPADRPEPKAGAKVVEDKDICVANLDKRSFGNRYEKRAGTPPPRVPDDAANWMKVYEWLRYDSGIDRRDLVFWSGDEYQETARRFAARNGMWSFHDIFSESGELGPKFSRDFGHVAVGGDTDINIACSKALASFARDPVVFNHDGARSSSYWRTYEYPRMYNAGSITQMKTNARTLDDVKSDVRLPPRPRC